MAERKIRATIRDICARLDRRAGRTSVRSAVVPAFVGAGLAMAGCAGTVETDGRSGSGGAGSGGAGAFAGFQPVYGAPDDGGPPIDAAYMAPDAATDAGGQPEYMAPDPDGG